MAEIEPYLLPLVPGYLRERREECGQLRADLEAGDLEAVAETGHRLAGSGGSYGFSEISILGQRLEAAGRAGDAAVARRVVDALEAAVDDALRDVGTT